MIIVKSTLFLFAFLAPSVFSCRESCSYEKGSFLKALIMYKKKYSCEFIIVFESPEYYFESAHLHSVSCHTDKIIVSNPEFCYDCHWQRSQFVGDREICICR